MFIGDNLKRFRTNQKMTLSKLSELSNVQLATLSRIEHKKMVGTLDCHMKIAKALGVDLSTLYINADETSRPTINIENSAEISVHTRGVSLEILAPQSHQKNMNPVLIKLDPKSKTQIEKQTQNIETFLYILEGIATIKVGTQSFTLLEGQSIYFKANQEHQIINSNDNPLKILSVTANN